MKSSPFFLCLFLISSAASQGPATQQIPNVGVARKPVLAVYAGSFSRDIDYFREQITFVNYTNDQSTADVVIQWSRQSTGAGGAAMTLTFTGQGLFAGMNDTLVIIDEPNDPVAVQQERRVQAFKLILPRYVAHTRQASQILVGYAGPALVEQIMEEEVEEEAEDPWNSWVFRVTGSGSFENEELQDSYSLSTALSANRLTEEWITRGSYNYSYSETNRRQKVVYSDTTNGDITFHDSLRTLPTTFSRNMSGSGGLVKTLGPHSGIGVTFNYLSNSRQNIQQRYRVAPAIEYNLLPYTEYSRRYLTFNLSTGLDAVVYEEETAFGKTEETLLSTMLDISYSRQATWGSMSVSLEYETYLPAFDLEDALDKNSISLDASISYRMMNGISINLSGGIARINNNLNILGRDLDPYERATGTVQLDTDFRVDGSLSVSYTFGALYNNVVNPRLGGGSSSGGGGFSGGGFSGGGGYRR